MPKGFSGVLREKYLELDLGALMLQERSPGRTKGGSERCPGVRAAHIHNAHRLDARARRLHQEQARDLTGLHAAPELAFCGDQEMLIEAIGGNRDLDPLAAPGDD